MNDVLIDTSTLLDLVLYYQQRHRRNRSVASSAAAAIEALVIYERPIVESASAQGISEAGGDSRFFKFYCDGATSTALSQFQSLLEFCGRIEVSAEQQVNAYDRGLKMLSESLAVIANPDDLRAYELYDYLPYHLGEDPTAIECQVSDPTASDLELIELPGVSGSGLLKRTAECLRAKKHPTRAAWTLPLLRLFYYQAIQAQHDVHFLPHATKSTIAFGREAETVEYRRLLDYCVEPFRETYLTAVRRRLGGLMIVLPIPRFADLLLRRATDWGSLISQVTKLRCDPAAIAYRQSITAFFELLEQPVSIEEQRAELEKVFGVLEKRCTALSARLGVGSSFRSIRVGMSLTAAAGGCEVRGRNRFILVHDLYSAIGISGAERRE